MQFSTSSEPRGSPRWSLLGCSLLAGDFQHIEPSETTVKTGSSPASSLSLPQHQGRIKRWRLRRLLHPPPLLWGRKGGTPAQEVWLYRFVFFAHSTGQFPGKGKTDSNGLTLYTALGMHNLKGVTFWPVRELRLFPGGVPTGSRRGRRNVRGAASVSGGVSWNIGDANKLSGKQSMTLEMHSRKVQSHAHMISYAALIAGKVSMKSQVVRYCIQKCREQIKKKGALLRLWYSLSSLKNAPPQ